MILNYRTSKPGRWTEYPKQVNSGTISSVVKKLRGQGAVEFKISTNRRFAHSQ